MGRRSQRWSGSASSGLIAVQIVGESSISASSRTMEIECPGGAVIRLREDISAEVLQRVMQACQQVQANGGGVSGSVRSC
jgi:hypothetical protein